MIWWLIFPIVYLVLMMAMLAFYIVGFVAARTFKWQMPAPYATRRIMVCIPTVGGAPDVVNSVIIPKLKQISGIDEIKVLIEESDHNKYDADAIKVPAAYATPNNSTNKHRALHYFSQWLKENGYGKETYVIHIDDDVTITQDYVDYVRGMEEEAGQGTFLLRAYHYNLLNTLADVIRIMVYDFMTVIFNTRHKPIGVAGDALVIRADVESQIGWDFQPVCAEDYLMGQSIVKAGYKFGYIPVASYIAPATTTVDFFKQRRRWTDHFIKSTRKSWVLNRVSTIYFLYLYLIGNVFFWVGIGGLAYLLILSRGSILFHPIFSAISYAFIGIVIATFFLSLFYINKLDRKWYYGIAMFILYVPLNIYNMLPIFYYLIKPPKTDITIRKV